MGSEPPSIIGARAELAVATGLRRAGYDVFTPFFAAHARVDLVALRGAAVTRLQVKTSRLVRGALVFKTCSNTRNLPADYRGEVDAFGVYSPELELVYLVPVEDVSIRAGSLRVEPARNNQQSGVRWAGDYLVGPP